MVLVGSRLVIDDPGGARVAVVDLSTGKATPVSLPGRRKEKIEKPTWAVWLVSSGREAYLIVSAAGGWVACSVDSAARVSGPWRFAFPEEGHVHGKAAPGRGLLFIYCTARE
jgi:hypothetical protein